MKLLDQLDQIDVKRVVETYELTMDAGTGGSAPRTAVYAARGTPFSSAQRAAEQGRVGVATVGGEPVVVQGAIVQGLVLNSNNV